VKINASPRHRASAITLTITLALCLGGAPLRAQHEPERVPARSTGSGSHQGSLGEVARHLADRFGARITVDPGILVTTPLRAPDEAPSIEPALTALAKSLRGVAWRRLYRPESQKEMLPPAEAMAAAARTLDPLDCGSLIMVDPTSRRATVYLKDAPAAPSRGTPREKWGLRDGPIYLIYSTAATADGRGPERQIADLQRQQLEIDAPEEQQALAMLQTVQLIQSLAPEQAEQLMRRTAGAGMRVWESTSPDQRAAMIQQSFRLMQRFGGPPAGAGAAGATGAARSAQPRRAPTPPAPANHAGELRTLAAVLAARDDATLLLDPELFLALPPASPPADLPIEEALRTMTAPLSGIAWRKLYLTDAQLKSVKRTSGTEKLVAAVRALEHLESGDLALEDAATGSVITYLKNPPLSPSLDTERAAWKLNDRPVYLLYSTTPAARGGTLLERFAHLQRQQMALMLRMSLDQMANAMEQVLQAYPSADPARQMRLMGLPVMAGMMATWFPRAAKEGESPEAP
jgi:hypothetical protein